MADRGYGLAHRRERERWATLIKQAPVTCARSNEDYCPKTPITPNTEWDLDHNADRTGYLGPAHSVCNRTAAGLASHKTMITREW